MNTAKFQALAQSVLHVAGSIAATLAATDPQLGALAQSGIVVAGAAAAFAGAVWSYVTPPAPVSVVMK